MTIETQVTDTSKDNQLAAMSDDEFLNAVASSQPVGVEVQPEQAVQTPEVKQTENVSTETQIVEPAATTTTEPSSTVTTVATDPTEQAVTEEVNHKDFYERMTKPFKANGREMQITNPDDAIKLMQMGTDYNRKMQELKPLKQLNAVLKQHEISNDDIALLIDLKQKKPEAIAKIVKDSGIDIYGFDIEQAAEYVPTQPEVPEVNDALESVLNDLKVSSPVFNQTIQIVGNQWDSASRDVLVKHPEVIRIIDAQVADGTFAKINQVVEYERTLGRLVGLSDLDAYVEIERKLAAKNQPSHVAVPDAVQSSSVTPQQQAAVNQRKSAAPPRQTTANTQPLPINSPALSDEEFLKQLAAQGLV